MNQIERETMDFDVVIVGAGPAGLSAAIRLKQINPELSVVVLEKGSEIGAHILSGAVLDTSGLDKLIPDWKDKGAPVETEVTSDNFYILGEAGQMRVPNWPMPPLMSNHGKYIVSMGNVCRWLAEQAEALEVEIFPGMACSQLVYEGDRVAGVVAGEMGLKADGTPGPGYEPGMELRGKYVFLSEGVRGSLAKEVIAKYDLTKGHEPQKYGIGMKEIWEIDPAKHKPGLVVHTAGWPLDIMSNENTGGSFLYHLENNQVVVGLIVDLSYSNTFLSPFDEFQRLKHHPVLAQYLEGGKRVSYGARAICKGGLNSLPKMVFKGGALIGCDLGTLNFAKIKGSHTAMKSGMLAADAVADRLFAESEGGDELTTYVDSFKASWLYEELFASRNFGPAVHKFGAIIGGGFNWLDQNIFGGKIPFTLHDTKPDYACLKLAKDSQKIDYPKPDGKLSFDKLSSVFISGTNHEEEQPCHLKLKDPSIPIGTNLPLYDEPAQRYCPAGVYEVVTKEDGEKRFQINAQNCVHCKTCDIKDPSQNITWVTPEGAGGPTYPNM